MARRKAKARVAGHLAAVSAGPGIGHGHGVRAVVPQVAADLIAKLAAPDGLTPRAISCGTPIAECSDRSLVISALARFAPGKLGKRAIVSNSRAE